MKKFLSHIFSGIGTLMAVLAMLMAFVGGTAMFFQVILPFCLEFLTLFFEGNGYGRLQNVIQELSPDFIRWIVLLGIAGICALLEKMFYSISFKLNPYVPSVTSSTSSSSTRSTSSSYSGSGRTYYFPDYEPEPSAPIDHDALDAVQRAMEISRIYGEDWTGYDPEAPGPDPEYSPTDIW